MAAKKENNAAIFIVGFVLLAVLAMVIIIVKKAMDNIKQGARDILDTGQDIFHSSPAGAILGVRGATAKRAEHELLQLPFLYEEFYEKAAEKYNTSRYTLDFMGTARSNELAGIIEDADSRIPLGLNDDSKAALEAVKQIKNQVQAAEVTRSYYLATAKDLAKGLTFVNDEAIIKINRHLQDIAKKPPGIYDKVDKKELSKVTL